MAILGNEYISSVQTIAEHVRASLRRMFLSVAGGAQTQVGRLLSGDVVEEFKLLLIFKSPK